jgi:hypothetical protein
MTVLVRFGAPTGERPITVNHANRVELLAVDLRFRERETYRARANNGQQREISEDQRPPQ